MVVVIGSVHEVRAYSAVPGQIRLPGEVASLLQLTFAYAVPYWAAPRRIHMYHLNVDGTFSHYSVGCGVMEQPVGFLEI